MYIYVDESGHSGARLFKDIKAQPNMYYGVLTSSVDLHEASASALDEMRGLLAEDRLHASALGNPKLARIAPQLVKLQDKLNLIFDFYILVKRDHAEFAFFDQVFDSGNNKAFPSALYNTTARYGIIMEMKSLFNAAKAERAWDIRVEYDQIKANADLTSLCRDLLKGIGRVRSPVARMFIRKALTWAAENPGELSFNSEDLAARQQISPNVICFQSVMHGIAKRVREEGPQPTSIIVDVQQEFNGAQKVLADLYGEVSGLEFETPAGMPKLTFDGMPKTPIQFVDGKSNGGLELVDVYLWVAKRLFERKPVAQELMPLYEKAFLNRGFTDQVSYAGIAKRYFDARRNAAQN